MPSGDSERAIAYGSAVNECGERWRWDTTTQWQKSFSLSPAASQAASPSPSEAVPSAQELARAHGRLVAQLRSQYGLTPADAAKRAERMADADAVERHLCCPSDAISWNALDAVARHDPDRAVEVWEGIKAEAREELATGHRAARAIEAGDVNCMTRARFLAIRDELTRDWRPTTGQERILIDSMAQALTTQEHWHRRMMLLDALEHDNDEPSEYKTPRMPTAAAIEQAANMVDRFNRIFMRALRQLRDLRRYAPQVVVKNAGQVNVGNAQVKFDDGSPNGFGATGHIVDSAQHNHVEAKRLV